MSGRVVSFEYVRIDENLPEHRKVLTIDRRIRPQAMWLYVSAICYCSRHLSDGFVPTNFFEREKKSVLDCLIPCFISPVDGGYLVHDYLHYNRSKEQVDAYVDAKRLAGALGGKAKANRKQTSSRCYPSACSKTYPEADTETKRPKTLSVSGKPSPVENTAQALACTTCWGSRQVVVTRGEDDDGDVYGPCPDCEGAA